MPQQSKLSAAQAKHEASRAKARSEAAFMGYTYDQLSAAFDAVKSKQHWKGPINKVLPSEGFDERLTEAAIIFYAGAGVSFTYNKKRKTVRVTAPGYWANGF